MLMDTRTLARHEARAQVFKALAHPSRLLIVDELMQSERCVCELTALVGSDMSTVSKHLSVLKAAGVVAGRAPRRADLVSPAHEVRHQVLRLRRLRVAEASP